MTIKFKRISILSLFLILISCQESKEDKHSNENDGWKKVGQVEKTIKNINFTFPESGFAFENKKKLIEESFDALKADSELIKLNEFNDTIFIRFLNSREDMFPLTGTKASGSAWPHINTLYAVSNENSKPPIKHELMHLIAMLEWDYPPSSTTWMNEGLGTFAENNCINWNVAEIYRYLLETDRLIQMDSLTSDFYNQPEMIAYHQSAYIVEYLLANYSIEKFEKLWKSGFAKFEEIYGFSFDKVKSDLEKELKKRYPSARKIDFERFNEGCE